MSDTRYVSKKWQSMDSQRWGRLVVLRKVGNKKTGAALVECVCDCGAVVTVQAQRLRSGRVKSCGCFRTKPKLPAYSDADLIRRFFSRVATPGNSVSCWRWIGATGRRGYGTISVNNKHRVATQVSWEIYNRQPFPAPLFAMHSCDNPWCVNPEHIRPGTHDENVSDAVSKGRMKQGWVFSREQAEEIRGLVASGISQRKVAKMFGVVHGTIQGVVNRTTRFYL